MQDFLDKLKIILEKEDFDIDEGFTLIRTKKKGDDDKYSTPYTLLDLDYDAWDVIERLKELQITEYSETKIDKDDVNPPILFQDMKVKLFKMKHMIQCFMYIQRRIWIIAFLLMVR